MKYLSYGKGGEVARNPPILHFRWRCRALFCLCCVFFAELMRVGTVYDCRQLLWALSTLKRLAPLIFPSFLLERNASFPRVQEDGQLFNRASLFRVDTVVLNIPFSLACICPAEKQCSGCQGCASLEQYIDLLGFFWGPQVEQIIIWLVKCYSSRRNNSFSCSGSQPKHGDEQIVCSKSKWRECPHDFCHPRIKLTEAESNWRFMHPKWDVADQNFDSPAALHKLN